MAVQDEIKENRRLLTKTELNIRNRVIVIEGRLKPHVQLWLPHTSMVSNKRQDFWYSVYFIAPALTLRKILSAEHVQRKRSHFYWASKKGESYSRAFNYFIISLGIPESGITQTETAVLSIPPPLSLSLSILWNNTENPSLCAYGPKRLLRF